MANVTVRAAVIRVASKKIAEAHSGDLSVASGDQAVFGAEGYLGHTQGATTCKLTLKAIIPVAGMSKDLTKLVLTKQRSSVTFLAGGIEYQIENAVAVNFAISSETQSGVLEGTFDFEGGVPTEIT